MSVMWARVWPAFGIIGWVIVFTGFFIHGYPDIGASPQALAHWAAITDPTRFAIGIDVEAIGLLVFLFFFRFRSSVPGHAAFNQAPVLPDAAACAA